MDMKNTLSLGWIAAAAFILGTLFLGALLPDYSPVSQTVSEIGEDGSPLYVPFKILSVGVAISLILFGIGLHSFAKSKNPSVVPSILVTAFGISECGIGLFAFPHPLHNVFGISMTVDYSSPLLFALLWKNELGIAFKRFSLLAFVLIALGIFLNLTPLFNPTLYPLEYYGIVQRFLLFTFYLYCAFVSYHTLRSYADFTRTAPNTV